MRDCFAYGLIAAPTVGGLLAVPVWCIRICRITVGVRPYPVSPIAIVISSSFILLSLFRRCFKTFLGRCESQRQLLGCVLDFIEDKGVRCLVLSGILLRYTKS